MKWLYSDALKIVRRYIRQLQQYNKEKKKRKKLSLKEKQHRTIIYSTENDIIETIKEIERFLPVEDRNYTNKHKDNRIIINNEIDCKYIPLNEKNLNEIISNEEYRNKFYKVLEKILSPQQFKVINLYYGMEMTQEEIAKELQITKQAVSLYLRNAYGKIIKDQNIRSFLREFE